MKVFITGAASHLAAALLPRLLAAPGVAAVTGLDLRPSGYAHPRYREILADVCTADWRALLPGHGALVHLAYVVMRGHTPLARMAAINVAASQRLFDAAAGLPRLVHLSSASVYGNGEDLAESAPLAPLPGFHYAQHKAQLDAWLAGHHGGVVRLRPHVILGPHAQPFLRRMAHTRFYPAVGNPLPRYQCVHEDDVAAAILAALEKPAAGPYNLAHPASFTLRELAARSGRHPIGLPLAAIKALHYGAWLLTASGGEPGWLQGLAGPLTLDCSRAARDLGWRAQHGLESLFC